MICQNDAIFALMDGKFENHFPIAHAANPKPDKRSIKKNYQKPAQAKNPNPATSSSKSIKLIFSDGD